MGRTNDQAGQVVDGSGTVAEAAGVRDEPAVGIEVGVAHVLELIDQVHKQIPAAQQAEAASKGTNLSPQRALLLICSAKLPISAQHSESELREYCLIE
jgi:hypothetical protein